MTDVRVRIAPSPTGPVHVFFLPIQQKNLVLAKKRAIFDDFR
jgi:glutamyl/glutaminyl-tRNA synthetase